MTEGLPYLCREPMRHGDTIVKLVQIMPALPGCFVLCRDEHLEKGAPRSLFRFPLVAWGLWDAFEGKDREYPERWRRSSGPLIYELGELVPAEIVLGPQFAGVRLGRWRELGDGYGWDPTIRYHEPEEIDPPDETELPAG